MSSPYAKFSADDVRSLVERYPLAWVCDTATASPEASQLPLIGEYDASGTLVALIGHMARSNPLHARLAADGQALMLFSGPSGYVSPSEAGKADWAPTWNYAHLRVMTEVSLSPDMTDYSLDVLIDAMEEGRSAPWSRQAIAHRYPDMASAIIGFRADVTSIEGRFKLGQDETVETLHNILRTHPDPALRQWMQRFNPCR